MRHFLIDTDTASDDAVALVMALNYPDVRVEAITVVSGNVHVDQAVQNALYTVELCGISRFLFIVALKNLFFAHWKQQSTRTEKTGWVILAYLFPIEHRPKVMV